MISFFLDKYYINSLDRKPVADILNTNIAALKETVAKYGDTDVKNFSEQLIKSVEEPVIYFGATDDKSAMARYSPVKDAVFIDADKQIGRARESSKDYYNNPEEWNKDLIANIAHEFLHRYDHKKTTVKIFFKKQCISIMNDILKTPNIIAGKDNFDKKMKLITKIMESIKPGLLKSYEPNESDKIRVKFYKFMCEVIPNICSEVAFKSDEDCRKDFLSNLESAAYQNNKIFTKEGLEAFAFLNFFLLNIKKSLRNLG